MKYANWFLSWAFWLSLLNLVVGYVIYSGRLGTGFWGVVCAIEYLIREVPSILVWSGVMTICGVLDGALNEWRRIRGNSGDRDSIAASDTAGTGK